MVISLQISAVSGRVLPSCLDHSALICETAESLRTAEHASLEWIYALKEAQKAEKKEILHLRNEVLYKKYPTHPECDRTKSQNSVLYDSLMNYVLFVFLN